MPLKGQSRYRRYTIYYPATPDVIAPGTLHSRINPVVPELGDRGDGLILSELVQLVGRGGTDRVAEARARRRRQEEGTVAELAREVAVGLAAPDLGVHVAARVRDRLTLDVEVGPA